MSHPRPGWAMAALAFATVLSGCGKPEETASTSDASESKTPPPPIPAWAQADMGRQLSVVAHGTVACKGVVDIVNAKHTGAVKGSEVQGWAWNETQSRAVPRILFTSPSGQVIGAGETSLVRKDVQQALPEVKTATVGWTGVVDRLDGAFRAYGLTEGGASCLLGSSSL